MKTKTSASSKKQSVTVNDLTARKNPKGGNLNNGMGGSLDRSVSIKRPGITAAVREPGL